jgi:hypothetical protein
VGRVAAIGRDPTSCLEVVPVMDWRQIGCGPKDRAMSDASSPVPGHASSQPRARARGRCPWILRPPGRQSGVDLTEHSGQPYRACHSCDLRGTDVVLAGPGGKPVHGAEGSRSDTGESTTGPLRPLWRCHQEPSPRAGASPGSAATSTRFGGPQCWSAPGPAGRLGGSLPPAFLIVEGMSRQGYRTDIRCGL